MVLNRRKFLNGLTLIAILGISFFLRVYKTGGTFHDPDSAIMPILIIGRSNLLWVFVHSYGLFTPLISELFNSIYMLFGIRITEFWWTFPVAVVGTLTVYVVYALVRLLYDEKRALFVSAMVGLLPDHIISSRYAYGYECGYLFLFLLVVYTFIRFLQIRTRGSGVFFSAVLTLYILTHALFPVTLILLFWIYRLYGQDDRPVDVGRHSSKIRTATYLIVPSAAVLLQVFLALFILYFPNIYNDLLTKYLFPSAEWMAYQLQTVLGHHLIRLNFMQLNEFGSGFEFLPYKGEFLSIWELWLYAVLASVLLGFRDISRREPRSIFYLWGVVYYIPFIMIEIILNAGMATYVSFGSVPLTIYAALFLHDRFESGFSGAGFGKKKFYKVMMTAGLLIYMYTTTCVKVFQIDLWNCIRNPEKPYTDEPNKYRSAYYHDVGFKTAGYYIRTFSHPDDLVYVYVHNLGGALRKYYLNRQGYNLVGDLATDIWLFQSRMKEIQLAIIYPEHERYFDRLEGFERKSRIFSKGLNGERMAVLSIYGRVDTPYPIMDMDVDVYNKLYDDRYALSGYPISFISH